MSGQFARKGKQRNERGYFGGGHNSETQWDRDPLHAVDNLTKREPERTEVSFPALAIVQKEEGALIQVPSSLFSWTQWHRICIPNGQGGEERLHSDGAKRAPYASVSSKFDRATHHPFFGGSGVRGVSASGGLKVSFPQKGTKKRYQGKGGWREEESKKGGRRNDFVLGMRRGILLPPPLSGKSRWKVVEE